MRRLAKLFDFTGYGCDDDGWCVSVSNIILNHHCRANTMLHRARLITEIHIINISSVNSFENTAFHKRASFPVSRRDPEIVTPAGSAAVTHIHPDLNRVRPVNRIVG